MLTILLTGGAGYIGSHTAVQSLLKGYNVVILDDLSNSRAEAINRIRELTALELTFVRGDVRDAAKLDEIFSNYQIDAVIHFAGLKSVGESHLQPVKYYDVNVSGTLSLVAAMERAGIKRLIFSSSATVYGEETQVPCNEDHKRGNTTNPYGTSKSMVEQILCDLANSDPGWSVTLLRYFNPIGAHPSGRIGEDPNDIPNNLMPYITQVAVGRLSELSVYGNDYPTRDGTGARDYIHVMDLADGHLAALGNIADPGVKIYNLGTGRAYTVLEMVDAFERVNGIRIPFKFAPRRDGDLAECWANPQKARTELNWKASRSLDQMIEDAWRWQRLNPAGYIDEGDKNFSNDAA